MEHDENLEYKLRIGQYLGDISALSFFFLPPASSLPYLLAGTGSQLLVYDLSFPDGNLLQSFRVFSGIRVHGISCRKSDSDVHPTSLSPIYCFDVAVFGEKRVKLFGLRIETDHPKKRDVVPEFNLACSLPRFSHWILDVSFLKYYGDRDAVAVGCSDNSIHVWDILNCSFCIKVLHPDRCLLYSMKLWGGNIHELRIASGTIFNEINIWKPADVGAENPCSKNLISSNNELSEHQHGGVIHVCKLVGHEGSIFRITWSSDGSKVVSASDDRSSRIWAVDNEKKIHGDLNVLTAKSVVFGHNARVWDCYISNSLIVTAGEDCTCRLWDLDGNQIKIIKEHTGRGVWRCMYDEELSLLVSAGFDSSIKVHRLTTFSRNTSDLSGVVDDTETVIFQIPFSIKKGKLMDSKSEYVRCLHLRSQDAMYVATNNGYLYFSRFFKNNDVKWTQLCQVIEGPIICMNVISKDLPPKVNSVNDLVAVGDGKGKITVVGVIGSVDSPQVNFVFDWVAEKERQLLGIYWCKAFGHRFIFTSDPAGNVKLWHILAALSNSVDVDLVAEFSSGLRFRIMCLDASFQDEVLVCGDLRGNIIVFPLLKSMTVEAQSSSGAKILSATYFKGAHGISPISSVLLSPHRCNEIEIRSTGGDGCICFLEFNKVTRALEFVGMKQIKEMSLIEAVASSDNASNDVDSLGYAVGFLSTDFIIWNAMNETKVARFPCGGWRRPHSFYLGEDVEALHCFAFLKEENIIIRKRWSPDHKQKNCLHNLHIQFHGREIHSLCFVKVNNGLHSRNELGWIVTGCEDGTVRLTSYSDGTKDWICSKMLGEHVGGSAVRSICFASQINKTETDTETETDPFVLLISAGAKGVITTWVLRNDKLEKNSKSSDEIPSLSFKWLSSDIPLTPSRATNGFDTAEDCLRHLAVTAFLVHCSGSKFTVCFMVIASSDASLNLRALVLPSRIWFDISSLVPLASPVLSLQHIVIPRHLIAEADMNMRNMFLVISGGTDGNISLWDITSDVDSFISYLSTLDARNLVNFNRRPRTGRGSQGGRLWKCSDRSIESGESQPSRYFSSSEVNPLRVLTNFHQSGVNCLNISSLGDFTFTLASGGDDQALHCLTFKVFFSEISDHLDIQLLCHRKVNSAHNSAVKGVWTNGKWVFSTGLDQRIRCWLNDKSSNLSEKCSIIVSVPEPEGLDVKICDSTNCYQIAVAGRGMQVVDFYDPHQ